MRRIHRADLKAAPWNPRKLDGYAKKKLQENLTKIGLLMPPVWNEATGNIVAGHQRLAIMDAIEGVKDYLLDVAVVHLTEQEEKQQCVFMNNESAMGTWDLEALERLVSDQENFSWEKAGFDLLAIESTFPELSRLFDPVKESQEVRDHIADTVDFADEVAAAKNEEREREKAQKAAEGEVEGGEEGEGGEGGEEGEEEIDPEDGDGIEGLIARRKGYRERRDSINSGEFYFTVVFPTAQHKIAFLRHIKESPAAEYLDGVQLAGKFGLTMTVSNVPPLE